jgi:antitoxin component YwqK of YwqJK toxin-antitoxin module
MESQELEQRDGGGRVVQRGRLVDGELDGELVQLDAAGAVLAKMSYKRGKLDGESLFYDGGKLKVRLVYRDGLQQGDPILYGDDGTPLRK